VSRERLRLALVPEPLWALSAYKRVSRKVWKQIRASALEETAGSCSVCGERRERGMVCHESWAYDDVTCTVTLDGFKIECPDCNAVSHLGQTALRGFASQALAHLAAVNEISLREAMAQAQLARDAWDRRSREEWVVRVAPMLLVRWAELAVLDGRLDDQEKASPVFDLGRANR